MKPARVPLAAAAGTFAIAAIVVAILLLTARPNSATSGIRMLTFDSTGFTESWIQDLKDSFQPVGVLPENIHWIFPVGSRRDVYYAGSCDGGCGLTNQVPFVADFLKPVPNYSFGGETHAYAGNEFVFAVSNGTGSADVGEVYGPVNEVGYKLTDSYQAAIDRWNATSGGNFDPLPASGLLIVGTSLMFVAWLGLIASVVTLGDVRHTFLIGSLGSSSVSFVLLLASGAYITHALNVMNAMGGSYVVMGNVVNVAVRYETSAAFMALTWVNVVFALLVVVPVALLVREPAPRVDYRPSSPEKSAVES